MRHDNGYVAYSLLILAKLCGMVDDQWLFGINQVALGQVSVGFNPVLINESVVPFL